MSCIFCGKPIIESNTEHILPRALGGDDWACLPKGCVCSKCNQYFGTKVETLAVASFPFLPFRLFLGIPTKRKKPPTMQTRLGEFRSGTSPGQFGLDPISPEVERAAKDGRITQLRILAEPEEPVAVCRMLLKMGIETVAADSPDDARMPSYDDARRFARNPQRGESWWFLLCVDHPSLFAKFTSGFTYAEWLEGVRLEITPVGEAEVFHLRLLDLHLMTPLHKRVLPPDMADLPEPEYRLFTVSA